MRHVLTYACLLTMLASIAQAQNCVEPEEPFVPSRDEDFAAYADMVAMDFERYFSDLTPYFRCIDDAREAAFARAHEVSKKRDDFWARAKRMGLTEEVAIDHPPIDGEEATDR